MSEKVFYEAERFFFRSEAGMEPLKLYCTQELPEERSRSKGETVHDFSSCGENILAESPYCHGDIQCPILAPSAEMGLPHAELP